MDANQFVTDLSDFLLNSCGITNISLCNGMFGYSLLLYKLGEFVADSIIHGDEVRTVVFVNRRAALGFLPLYDEQWQENHNSEKSYDESTYRAESQGIPE